MPINNAVLSERNIPRPDDTTAELIRKHKIYKKEWERIVNDEIKRGDDYWGGYDESVGNEVTEISALLYKRAYLHEDLEAQYYIFAEGVSCGEQIRLWVADAQKALLHMERGELDAAKEYLKQFGMPRVWHPSDDSTSQ